MLAHQIIKICSLVILVILSASAQAAQKVYYTTDKLEEIQAILPRAEEPTNEEQTSEENLLSKLFIIDVDEVPITLHYGRFGVNTKAWSEHMQKYQEAQGIDPLTASQRIALYREWEARCANIEPVEKTTPSLINRLQKKGRVLFLSARDPSDLEITQAQLKEVGIKITNTISPIVPNETVQTLHISDELPPARYAGGVCCTGYNPKGLTILGVYTQILNYAIPPFTLFVDDQLGHVEEVQKTVSACGFPIVCCLYERMKNDPFIAKKAEKRFEKLLRFAAQQPKPASSEYDVFSVSLDTDDPFFSEQVAGSGDRKEKKSHTNLLAEQQ